MIVEQMMLLLNDYKNKSFPIRQKHSAVENVKQRWTEKALPPLNTDIFSSKKLYIFKG